MLFGVELLISFVTITFFYWLYCRKKYLYWNEKNVPSVPSIFPFGSPPEIGVNPGLGLAKYYKLFKEKGCKHGGLFVMTKPLYIPVDPELIKNIFTKDFEYFMNRSHYFNEKDTLTVSIFNLIGSRWKKLRSKLNAAFTPGKMQLILQDMIECGVSLQKHLDKAMSENKTINIYDISNAFAIDITGYSAFGIDCKSFENYHSDFRRLGESQFHPSKIHAFRILMTLIFPNLCKFLNVKLTTDEMWKFYTKTVMNSIKDRRENNVQKQDLLQLLIDLENSDNEVVKITQEEVIAQAYVFFVASFETMAVTLSFCLLELSYNQDIQEKARDEILLAYEEFGNFSYEALMQMTYVTQVVEETLRKYTPFGFNTRTCTKDYKIPDTDITLEKDTFVFISNYGIHHDDEYYHNPELFDPDRFTEENKMKRHKYTFIPFGQGPRICIGERFAMLGIKLGLAMMLQKYKFTLNSKTKYPPAINPETIIISPKDELLLDLEKI